MFMNVSAGREELIPPRVPGAEFSSSTSSAMGTPRRIGAAEGARGGDGERSPSEPTPRVERSAEVVVLKREG